jgi:hypothetical protein
MITVPGQPISRISFVPYYCWFGEINSFQIQLALASYGITRGFILVLIAISHMA